MSLYTILECNPNSSAAELRQAYHKLAKTNHPDKGGTSENFQIISAAYKILSCDTTRKIYDASIVDTGLPVHADLTTAEFSMDAATSAMTLGCRCGGAFMLWQTELQDEPILVPCDSCSLHVRVWNLP